MQWQIEKIINVANELARTGRTAASTSEQIAAVFVLDQDIYLPEPYQNDPLAAWERLGSGWQDYINIIRCYHSHRIEG